MNQLSTPPKSGRLRFLSSLLVLELLVTGAVLYLDSDFRWNRKRKAMERGQDVLESRSLRLLFADYYVPAILEFHSGTGSFPSNAGGLSLLVVDTGIAGWQGAYLDPLYLPDAWGEEIRYTKKGESIILSSSGPDRLPMTPDDISITHHLHSPPE